MKHNTQKSSIISLQRANRASKMCSLRLCGSPAALGWAVWILFRYSDLIIENTFNSSRPHHDKCATRSLTTAAGGKRVIQSGGQSQNVKIYKDSNISKTRCSLHSRRIFNGSEFNLTSSCHLSLGCHDVTKCHKLSRCLTVIMTHRSMTGLWQCHSLILVSVSLNVTFQPSIWLQRVVFFSVSR